MEPPPTSGRCCLATRADWPRFGRFGPDGAGFRRNRAMLTGDTSDVWRDVEAPEIVTAGRRADMLIAFPGHKGTAHCIRTANKLGIPVKMIPGW